MTLPLNSRTEEIANKLPKKYKNIILNAIIAKSLENGIFIEEVSIYFSTEEVEDIINNLGVKFTTKKRSSSRSNKIKGNDEIKKRKKEEEEENLFIGFDED